LNWWRTAPESVIMWRMRVRARLRTLSFWLNFVLFLVAAYLVVAVGLSDHDVPSKNAWMPWRLPFLSLVAAGIYVAFVAFYEYLRAQSAAVSQRTNDVNRTCQLIAWRIIETCKELDPAKLTVGVWLTNKDGTFDRGMRFLLPAERPTSAIVWRRGIGVVGSLWGSEDGDRLEKLVSRNEMSADDFGKLSMEDRLGLTHAQWKNVRGYTGVVAVKLMQDTGTSKKLLGFLVIDYRGNLKKIDDHDILDTVATALQEEDLLQLRGSLVQLLKEV
jgi:hypothetical protein